MITFDINKDKLTAEELLRWGRLQPWGAAMAQCPQDPKFHTEGDVWKHTQLVCRAMEDLPERQSQDPVERNILLLAALLHDCGKPQVTKMENGRIRSKNHGTRGAYLARGILRDAGIPPDHRERVVKLVRFHNRPTYIFKQEEEALIQADVARLSWETELPLMIAMAKADTLGGIPYTPDDRMERVELLRLQAGEMECFAHPFRPDDHHARFLFFRGEIDWLDYKFGYAPFEDYCCTVTMMSGLPGAGKDYWISRGNTSSPGEIIGLDGIRKEMKVDWRDNQGRVVQEARDRIKKLLASGTDFVFNAANTVWRWRRNWISLFHQYGARIKIVYIEPRWEVLLKQNNKRQLPVPEAVIQKKFDKLDIPTLTECHEIQYHVYDSIAYNKKS